MNSNLNYKIKVTGILIAIMFIMFYDIAEAQYGSRNRERRRTRRRTAVVVSSETHAQDEAAEQQKDQQQQQTTQTTQNNQQQQETTTPPPPATTSPGGALAIGTVVTSLPSGCTSSSVNNVEYYECGPNWYRSAFQGNTLVYVTTDPPK